MTERGMKEDEGGATELTSHLRRYHDSMAPTQHTVLTGLRR